MYMPPNEGLRRLQESYVCPFCKKRYLPSNPAISCTLQHAPYTCCHFGESLLNEFAEEQTLLPFHEDE